MRDRIYQMLEGESDSLLGKIISSGIILAILVSSIAFVLETIPEYAVGYQSHFEKIELVVVVIFSIEYILRLVTARNRLRFMTRPLNIVDFLSIVPFYLELLFVSMIDLRILRIVRMIRIFRLFKLSRYSQSFSIIMRTLQQSICDFCILLTLVCIVMVLFSSIMYSVEHDAHIVYCSNYDSTHHLCQGKWVEGKDDPTTIECPLCHTKLDPPAGTYAIAKNFCSIPKTFWWCIVTMTTVGYGDVVPQTNIGKVLAGLTMLFGILCIALPTGVMATKFLNILDEQRKKNTALQEASLPTPTTMTCPHCGHILENHLKD